MSQLNNEDRAQLREFLADRFNLDEMKTLCFDLGLDYEEFPHATKTEFSRELIVYFERHNKMGCLVAEMLEVRPDAWLTQLLAQVSSCQPNQKVQVVLSNDKIKSRPDLKQKLAELLGISAEEVMIIATAPGSVKLLLGVPPRAAGRLNGLSLPYQLNEYEIVSVTPYAALPPAAQTGWRASAMHTAVTHSPLPPTTAPATAVASTGLTLGLKILISILIIIGVIVVGVVVWGNRQPELTIANECATALAIPAPAPIKALLSLPDSIPPGGTLSIPILTGEGVYELLVTRGGVMVLRLPRPLPGLGLQDVELGAMGLDTAVTLDGRPLTPPQQFQINTGQSYELVICAPIKGLW